MKTLLYQQELLKEFHQQINKAKHFHIAMALITSPGLASLQQCLIRYLERGGTGRILIGVDMPTSPDAIESLLRTQKLYGNQLSLRFFKSSKGRILHAKFVVFEQGGQRKTAIVGSSKFTLGGLIDNYEANVLVTEDSAAAILLDYFEAHYQGGRSQRVTEKWLDQYRALWKERQKCIKALRRARERVRRIRLRQKEGRLPPRRIKDYSFCFTGKIED